MQKVGSGFAPAGLKPATLRRELQASFFTLEPSRRFVVVPAKRFLRLLDDLEAKDRGDVLNGALQVAVEGDAVHTGTGKG